MLGLNVKPRVANCDIRILKRIRLTEAGAGRCRFEVIVYMSHSLTQLLLEIKLVGYLIIGYQIVRSLSLSLSLRGTAGSWGGLHTLQNAHIHMISYMRGHKTSTRMVNSKQWVPYTRPAGGPYLCIEITQPENAWMSCLSAESEFRKQRAAREIIRRVAESQGRFIMVCMVPGSKGRHWHGELRVVRVVVAIRDHAHAGRVDEDLKLPLTRKHW